MARCVCERGQKSPKTEPRRDFGNCTPRKKEGKRERETIQMRGHTDVSCKQKINEEKKTKINDKNEL